MHFGSFWCIFQRTRAEQWLRIEGEVTTTNKDHVADLLAVAKKAPGFQGV